MKTIAVFVILSSLIIQANCQENFIKELDGKILMSDGSPAVAWDVFMYGVTSSGTTTNTDGTFHLSVANEEFYIKASFQKKALFQKVEKGQSSIVINVTKEKLKRAKKSNMDSVKFEEDKFKQLLALQGELENNRNDFYRAKQDNTLASYSEFLDTHSDTPYIDSVNCLYKDLYMSIQTEFQQVKEGKSVDELGAFKSKYRNTVFADSCQVYINRIKLATKEFILLSEDLNFTDTLKISQLLDVGADINAKNSFGGTFLIMASQEGHTNIVLVLLNRGANIHATTDKGNTALYYASKNGKTELVRLLLENSANANIYENGSKVTPLFVAAQHGHYEIVKLLFNAGAEVNISINTGRTPLMQAAQSGYTTIGSYLIEKGAEIDVMDKEGWSAFILATQQGHLSFVKMLIENNGDVNLANSLGVTPLFMACQSCNTEIVQQLIFAKADVNKATNSGATPLIIASQQKSCYKIVKILLSAGANANATMEWKGVTHSSLKLAEVKGNSKIVEALKQYGAHH